MDHNVD